MNQNEIGTVPGLFDVEGEIAGIDSSHRRFLSNPFLPANRRGANDDLAGLRVLDLGGIPSALAARFLADLGADVVRVEFCADAMTRVSPGSPSQPSNQDVYVFEYYNRNKRVLNLDLATHEGREQLRSLGNDADIVILSEHASCPALPAGAEFASAPVTIRITPFGTTTTRRGCDLTLQAAGGMLHANDPSDPRPGFGLAAYHCSALVAVFASLAALRAVNGSHRRQEVDLSIQASVVSFVSQSTSAWLSQRPDRSDQTFQVVPCADGFVAQSLRGDWTSLREWVGDCSLPVERPDPNEIGEIEQTFSALERWAAGFDVDALVATAQSLRLPFGAVRSLAAVASDPHLRARGCFRSRASEPRPSSSTEITSWKQTRRTRAVSGADGGFPLAGIRVLDLTWQIAGPLTTRLLADLGAEVIKVERLSAAQEFRHDGLFAWLNRKKRSISLDLDRIEGRDIARSIASHCNVVIDNFSSRVMHNLQLDSETLRAANSKLITISMTGFGASGPRRDHVAFAATLHAESGFTSLMCDRHGRPRGWGFAFSDYAAGYGAATLILAALRNGRGRHIDFSQLENLIALIGPEVSIALDSHEVPPARESWEPNAAPYGVYRCADENGNAQWCAIAVFDESEWMRLCDILGQPDWCRDRIFRNVDERSRHRDALDEHVHRWTGARSARSVAAALQGAGLCAAMVAGAGDLVVDDPLAAFGYWQKTELDGVTSTTEGLPFRMSLPHRTGGAPRLGQHTDAILLELLKLDDDEIRRLRHRQIVG